MTTQHRLPVWVPRSCDGPERIEYSADPRHMELLCSQLGFQQGKSRSVTTPHEKQAITPATEAEVEPGEAALYRSAKEAARGMSKPTVRHMNILKRCVRYLLQAPTLVWLSKAAHDASREV